MFERAKGRLGDFIGRHPCRHIAASLALAALCTLSLRHVRIENDIRTSLSPLHSRSSYEFAAYKEFFGLRVLPERSSISFSARDGGSMLRRSQLEELLALDARYMRTIAERDPASGQRGCDPQCDINLSLHKIFDELLRIYRAADNLSAVALTAAVESPLRLDFPFASLHGHRLFVGMNFVDVRFAKPFPQNQSRITHVKTIILWYFSRADNEQRKEHLRNISVEFFAEARAGPSLEHVQFEIFGDHIANMEMVRGALEATMLMSIGFGILLLFMVVAMRRKVRHELSMARTLALIVVALLCPIVSSASAFGILTWAGREIYTIMCITPFLICGISVDDAFIMLQSWCANAAAVPSPRRRISVMLMHAGPSIAITSLTNTVAFGIGYATPTPQMSLFCLCTSLAMFINYIFTLSIFAPTLVLLTHDASLEIEKPIASLPAVVPIVGSDETPRDCGATPLLPLMSEPPLKRDPLDSVPSWIRSYSAFLCSYGGRLVGALIFGAFLTLATLGVMRMKSSFEPSKAFPSDSPLSTSIQDMRLVFDKFFLINMFVHRPPNISDPQDRRLFYRMIDELEDATDSSGENRTLLWLPAYEEFDRSASQLYSFLGVEHRPGYENLDYFLGRLNYPPSIKTELDEHGVRHLRAFQFAVVAQNMTEWLNRAIVEQKCREVLDRYPFNTTLYDGDSAVLNLLLTAKLDLVGSIVVTIACMTVICSFFIAHKAGVIVMSLTITSICYMLVGAISWWGADLDPVTIVDVMLATGFSVDYTAHVAHQFYAKRGGRRLRIALALHEMLVPTLEASGSTLLCMLPLAFVPTYAIVNFAKTIFAVVGAGLFHGLFFMPLLLCALPAPRSHSDNEIPPSGAAKE